MYEEKLGEDVGKLKFLYTVVGDVNWLLFLETFCSQNLKYLFFCQAISILRIHSTDIITHVQRSITVVIKVCFEIVKTETLRFINKKIVKLLYSPQNGNFVSI